MIPEKIWVSASFWLLISCADNNKNITPAINKPADKSSTNAIHTATSESSNSAAQGHGILGYWKLLYEAIDENNNKKLDDEERRNGLTGTTFSFRFNADGSCIISDGIKGHYEVEKGQVEKLLKVYYPGFGPKEKNPRPQIYAVTLLTKNELELREYVTGANFMVLKREK